MNKRHFYLPELVAFDGNLKIPEPLPNFNKLINYLSQNIDTNTFLDVIDDSFNNPSLISPYDSLNYNKDIKEFITKILSIITKDKMIDNYNEGLVLDTFSINNDYAKLHETQRFIYIDILKKYLI